MPAVKLSPLFNGQTVTSAGDPASGYKVYTYAAGSSTQLAAYTDSTGNTPQANPVVLNASGYPANPIWLQAGLSYKFVLKDANDVQVGSWDGITGVNDASSSTSQWLASSVAPAYVSAASFTVPGDQTGDFHVGRRLQFSVTAGTVYGTITSSAYSSLTTVGVQMDSGQALDSGLSSVNLSILRADRLALPSFVSASPGVRGLTGSVNAATPLTKYDLNADAVTLRNAAGSLVTRFSSGALTCDLGLAGPVANGRDQAGAFAANSWVNLFHIWNGTALALIASTASHTIGPTLPTGYTHWCYATTIRWNTSSNIERAWVRGRRVFSDPAVSVLNGGTSATETAISLASIIPPAALTAVLKVHAVATGSGGGAVTDASVRVTPASEIVSVRAYAASGFDGYNSVITDVPNVNQNIYYLRTFGGAGSGSCSIHSQGYTVPNGDA